MPLLRNAVLRGNLPEETHAAVDLKPKLCNPVGNSGEDAEVSGELQAGLATAAGSFAICPRKRHEWVRLRAASFTDDRRSRTITTARIAASRSMSGQLCCGIQVR